MITFAADLLGALLAFLPLVGLIVIVCVIACALQRNWPRLPARFRIRRVPSRNPDGRPLTQAERERLVAIEAGYGPAPRVLRRVR